MWKASAKFSAVALAIVGARALQVQPPGAAAVAITGVSVVNVQAGRAVPDQTVIVRGNRVDQVGPSATTRTPRDSTVVDGHTNS